MCFLLLTLTYFEIRNICRLIKAQHSTFFPFIPPHVPHLTSIGRRSVISSPDWRSIWEVRNRVHQIVGHLGDIHPVHEPGFDPGISTKFGNSVYIDGTIRTNMTIRGTWTAVFPLELLSYTFLQSPLKSISNHSAFPIFVTEASEVLDGTLHL